MLTRLHFTLIRVWIFAFVFMQLGCKTLYPNVQPSSGCRTGTGMTAQTNCDELYATEEASLLALADAGLTGNTLLLNGIDLRVHPDSDGFRWNIVPLLDGGTWGETGNAGAACAAYPPPRYIFLANDAWSTTPLCHEMGHVLLNRARVGERARVCLSVDDHDIFKSIGLDTKCSEAVRPVRQRFRPR